MALEEVAAKAGVAVGHALARTVSVVAVLLVVAGLGAAVYFGFIRPNTKPNPTTTQNADRIQNIYIQPKQTFFGCTAFRLVHPITKRQPINATVEE